MCCLLAIASEVTPSPIIRNVLGKVANILRGRPSHKTPKYKTNYYYKPVTASPVYYKTVTEPDFTVLEDFDWWNNISKYIDDPYGALEKAQKLLEDLTEYLPDAIEKMDPATKSDIKEINLVILEVCDKAVIQANRGDSIFNSWYTPKRVEDTCAFIRDNVMDVTKGLDDPAVIEKLVKKLGKFGELSRQMAELANE